MARYRSRGRRSRLFDAFPCRSLPGPRPGAESRPHSPPGPRPDRRDGIRGSSHRDPPHRLPGVLHRLPRARRAGQGSSDAGSAVRRAPGTRHRRGLERRRVRGDGLGVRSPRPANRQAGGDDCRSSRPTGRATNSTSPAEFVKFTATRAGHARCSVPHPPIIIGGGGQRVLTCAGREADIVSISNVPFVARNAGGLDPQQVAERRIGSCVRPQARASTVWTSRVRPISRRSPTTLIPPSQGSRQRPACRPRCSAIIPMFSSGRWKPLWRCWIRVGKLGVNYVTVQQTQIECSLRSWRACTVADA